MDVLVLLGGFRRSANYATERGSCREGTARSEGLRGRVAGERREVMGGMRVLITLITLDPCVFSVLASDSTSESKTGGQMSDGDADGLSKISRGGIHLENV